MRCRFCGALAEQRQTTLWWCTSSKCNAVRAPARFWVRLGPRAKAGEPLSDNDKET